MAFAMSIHGKDPREKEKPQAGCPWYEAPLLFSPDDRRKMTSFLMFPLLRKGNSIIHFGPENDSEDAGAVVNKESPRVNGTIAPFDMLSLRHAATEYFMFDGQQTVGVLIAIGRGAQGALPVIKNSQDGWHYG